MSWEPRITEVLGAFPAASNATLLAQTDDGRVIYKPISGERPLWDFDADTLAIREYLTYEVSVALGISCVPETVLGEGPYGAGAIQRYVEPDETVDIVPLVNAASPALWPVALLDLVCNNADRKVGHMLVESGTGRLWAIDHGLTFHPDEKLRTVLWGFAGRRVPSELVEALKWLRRALNRRLAELVSRLLDTATADALSRRVDGLLEHPVHPLPPVDRPSIPWPPY